MRFNRRSLTVAAGACTLLVFIALFVRVFQLSSESGALFAPYSTFRADPLGTMALYKGLHALDGASVERFMQDFDAMPEGEHATFVIAGAGLGLDPVPVLESIEEFVSTGGRVVIAFSPIHDGYDLESLRDAIRARDETAADKEDAAESTDTDETPAVSEPATSPGGDDHPLPEGESPKTEPALEPPAEDPENPEPVPDFTIPLQDISERWGFDYGYTDPGNGLAMARMDDSIPIESTSISRTGLYFRPEDDAWKPIRGLVNTSGDPDWIGIMGRPLGLGTIVLCSDAYFLSNEALRVDRTPGLITWALGAGEHVYFSETHLGTQQRDRIMTLVRRYRLHGVLFGFILVGLLFVWRHSATLIPRRNDARTSLPATLAERSHQDGLDNLLARFIPPGQLLDTCVREWSHQFHNNPKAATVQRLYESFRQEAGRAGGQAALVAAFNEIAREIHRK